MRHHQPLLHDGDRFRRQQLPEKACAMPCLQGVVGAVRRRLTGESVKGWRSREVEE